MTDEQKKAIAAMIVRYDKREDRCIDCAYKAKEEGDKALADKFRRWAHTNAARESVIEDVLRVLGYKVIWVDEYAARIVED